MNVASLDLCKKLYQLSGWASDIPYGQWSLHEAGLDDGRGPVKLPSYDLGYLMRKLPYKQVKLRNFGKRGDTAGWSIQWRQSDKGGEDYQEEAETPEDAAAKLCIELLKHGVLPTPEGSR